MKTIILQGLPTAPKMGQSVEISKIDGMPTLTISRQKQLFLHWSEMGALF